MSDRIRFDAKDAQREQRRQKARQQIRALVAAEFGVEALAPDA